MSKHSITTGEALKALLEHLFDRAWNTLMPPQRRAVQQAESDNMAEDMKEESGRIGDLIGK